MAKTALVQIGQQYSSFPSYRECCQAAQILAETLGIQIHIAEGEDGYEALVHPDDLPAIRARYPEFTFEGEEEEVERAYEAEIERLADLDRE